MAVRGLVLLPILAAGTFLPMLPANAADLSTCGSVQSWNQDLVVYTASCPSGTINSSSQDYYAHSPKASGVSFGKQFRVKYHRQAGGTSLSGSYGKTSVSGTRTKRWVGSNKFALTAQGTFGGKYVSCSTTGKLRGPGIDKTTWGDLSVNGNTNRAGSSAAFKKCAFLLLVQEAYAYTAV